MPRRQSDLRIGISGWTYTPWRGPFYPQGLVQHRELEYAASRFNSIEINGSFYSLQRPSSYRSWRDTTPEGFVFSIKGGRFITHMRKLLNVRVPLANFFVSGVLELGPKLGPILWQFPPVFKFIPERFEQFFQLLPTNTEAAAELAKEHSLNRPGGFSTDFDRRRPLRHAVEIRHDSFKDERFIALLRKYNVALVFADAPMTWPYMEDLTADFVYCRLHGELELYAGGYTDAALTHWADRIRLWRSGRQPKEGPRISRQPPPKRSGRDVFVYFDNDRKVLAPVNALDLSQRLNLHWAQEHEKEWGIKKSAE